jgi:Tfp pilus assembly protein PilF
MDGVAQSYEYFSAGKHDLALRAVRQAIAAEPDHDGAFHLLGHILQGMKFSLAALAFVARALRLNPSSARCHCTMAGILLSLGRHDSAVTEFKRAIAKDSGLADAHFRLGLVYQSQGEIDVAIRGFRCALALRPDLSQAWNNLGVGLKSKGLPDAAVRCIGIALAGRPKDVSALNNLGNVLQDLGRLEDALRCYEMVLDTNGGDADACYNRGVALARLNRPAEAIDSYLSALRSRPEHAWAHNNLGLAYQARGDMTAACSEFRRAVCCEPQATGTRWNLVMATLLAGWWAEGWRGFELRFQVQGTYPSRPWKPRWRGERFAGRRLLVHDEIGYGDVFNFLRFLPTVKALGGEVAFEGKPGLRRLLRGYPGIDAVYDRGSPLLDGDAYDLVMPLESLPARFCPSPAAVRPPEPWLRAPSELLARWRVRLGGGDGLRAGLVWQGSPGNQHDRERSCRLAELWAALRPIAGVRWFSLQKGAAAADIARLGLPIVDLDPELTDFADTAAALAELDLLLTVETSVAHLAGALGRPTWILLPYAPVWRWLLDRNDSPWYPSVRLFRQTSPGAWSHPLNAVANALIRPGSRSASLGVR